MVVAVPTKNRPAVSPPAPAGWTLVSFALLKLRVVASWWLFLSGVKGQVLHDS
jgi:hypothetical protein